jgi:hypothetical protein
MQPNIEDILAFELKKELADRYFGFRKMIEDDKQDLNEKIKYQTAILEKRIGFELIRLYILFKDEDLIHSFMELTGWEEKLFYDPYITESPTIRKRVFRGIRIKGLTRGGRFNNLVMDAYERLIEHVAHYREKLEELETSRETINEMIILFYKKNDIGSIMDFFRSMDTTNGGGKMMGSPDDSSAETFRQKMKIDSLPPIDELLTSVPPLAPIPSIRKKLKELIDRAYKLHGDNLLADIAK